MTLAVSVFPRPVKAEAQPLKPGRAVIFDLEADEETRPHLPEARATIEQLLADHAGFEPIADALMRRALIAKEAADPTCARSDVCRRSIGQSLHADHVLSGTLKKKGGRFFLEISVAPANTLDSPQTSSESMKHIKNLPVNVKLCLDRLFLWSDSLPSPAQSTPLPGTNAPPADAAPSVPPTTAPVMPPPAASAPASSKTKDKRPVLALLTVRAGTGFTDAELSSVEEGLLSALEETARFQVVGRTDIATLLDLEARKQMVGCEEDGCMTAIAGSLGADFVASANVGRLGSAVQLTFKVIDARRALVVVHARQTVSSDSQLVTAANEISDEVVKAVFGKSAPLPVHKNIVAAPEGLSPAAKRNLRGLGIAATVVGGLTLVAGAVLAVVAHSDTTAARTKATAPLSSELNTINTLAVSSDALFGAGGAVAAAGVGLTVAF
jgi:TolB-like protein